MKIKPILCLDFDGVLHSYTSGWQGTEVIPDPPVDGLFEFLWEAIKVFDVQIYSSRSNSDGGIRAMRTWLAINIDKYWNTHPDMPEPRVELINQIKFPTHKPAAFIGLDDRVLTFTGEFPSIESLQNFQPWNKRKVGS